MRGSFAVQMQAGPLATPPACDLISQGPSLPPGTGASFRHCGDFSLDTELRGEAESKTLPKAREVKGLAAEERTLEAQSASPIQGLFTVISRNRNVNSRHTWQFAAETEGLSPLSPGVAGILLCFRGQLASIHVKESAGRTARCWQGGAVGGSCVGEEDCWLLWGS